MKFRLYQLSYVIVIVFTSIFLLFSTETNQLSNQITSNKNGKLFFCKVSYEFTMETKQMLVDFSGKI